jgi:hypothetical protein
MVARDVPSRHRPSFVISDRVITTAETHYRSELAGSVDFIAVERSRTDGEDNRGSKRDRSTNLNRLWVGIFGVRRSAGGVGKSREKMGRILTGEHSWKAEILLSQNFEGNGLYLRNNSEGRSSCMVLRTTIRPAQRR